MVGMVFLTEGIQKFIYPATRGAEHFEDMGDSYHRNYSGHCLM